MSDVAIRVQNLSKRYRIERRSNLFGMHELLEDVVKAPVRMFVRTAPDQAVSRSPGKDRGTALPGAETGATVERDLSLWALQDVSLEVARGEIVGLIGRNGAGKSVLLKILARITKPTNGRAQLLGRIGSMLEVGTGFHPELSGRENIYLNGTILGMKKAEINRKFDEIIAFSEVEKFLDTPVKHYSSGMKVRLAFAVAAHLEAEILLLDEVLAVGDESFHEKCVRKLGEVVQEGRAVLFVSHDMATIECLCPRTVFLREGRVDLDGETRAVIARYLELNRAGGC
jgi:lipopolysaccharide transport system ATP-binding protein